MYLKRLEMVGFKSFPEKIRLEFNMGITAVVGPNGSGKSNVSDAVRWVLGEQSAKSLRGAKMEDVIFAGTANRKPLGFAEVAMTVDNSDGGLKIGFEEVTVTRRVYRSGESEYSINGTSCRLKDIHELFMDTGIGKEGYSIIGQGRVEEVLSSKGEERRHLFEEAAGIVKFKNRRFDALNKLEKERQNLERISDIITEIEGNLEPLYEQSEKAREFLKFSEELKLVQMNIFINEVETTQERIDKIDNNIKITDEQLNNVEKAKAKLEGSIEEYKVLIEEIETLVDDLGNKTTENRSLFEQAENDIVLRNEQIQHINSDIDNLKIRIDEKSTNIELNLSELNKFRELLANIDKELTDKTNLLEKKNGEFTGFSSVMTEEEQQVERLNGDIIDLMQAINNIDNDINRAESMYEHLESRMEQINEELSSLDQRKEDTDSEKMRLSQIIAEFDEKNERLNNSLIQLATEKGQLSNNLAENKDLLTACSKKLHEAEYRYKMLEELEKSYEGYQKSVKVILSHKKSNPDEFSGVIGAVGELIKVEKKYETAIEISLGAAIQNIVTESDNDAKKAIDYLKKTNSGRATFLPLNTVKARNSNLDKSLLGEAAVVGTAYDLCSFDSKYSNIFSSLLANTAIVDTMENALILSKKYKYSARLVTLTGELFNPGGSITGGSVAGKSAGIFGRKREMSTLVDDITELSKEETKRMEIIDSIKKQLDAVDFQRSESAKSLQAIEVEKSASTEKLEQINRTIIELNNKALALDNENKLLMEQIVECNNNLRNLELGKIEKEKKIVETKEEINKLNEIIIIKRLEKDNKYKEIMELNIEIASLEEKRANFSERISTLDSSNSSNTNVMQKLNNEISAKEQELAMRSNDIKELMQNKENLMAENIRLQVEYGEKNSELKEVKDKLGGFEAQNLELVEQTLNLNNEKSRLELQKEHIDENLRKIYDTMWEEYEVTYNQAKTYPLLDMPANKLMSREKTLKNNIRTLGNVNVGAIEEYKLLSERHEFLTKQSADIQDAEVKLKDVIAQLTQLMENQFKEHFAIISSNFSSVFSDIFGGGTAYLQLADENNVLESGIDIIAKPPGKALQSLSLLSGGERSLTATALLFAILRMKPSPFCILDEIESALDDANVVRYVNYLQNFCTDTQFILITHRKSVMEAADVLYGITMQEQGVSTLVSVKLEDASA
ncbi:chromosome segregation protein SMC [Tyzzerella sp. OttesenSCG-928-J15]|nr:chromosome segregation protein SMC [Tyzzerella sp. OttesenSCG-928-J15]